MADELCGRLLRDILAAADPSATLHDLLACAATPQEDARAALLFEGLFHRLSFLSDTRLPAIAARVYARLGRLDAAQLLDGLAIQMQPSDAALADAYLRLRAWHLAHGRPAAAAWLEQRLEAIRPGSIPPAQRTPAGPPLAEAEAIAASDDPNDALRRALAQLVGAGDDAGAVRLFESVWHRLPSCNAYWALHRMGDVYARLGRMDAGLVLSSLTLALDPAGEGFESPNRRLLAHLQARGFAEAVLVLVERQRLLHPHAPILDDAQRETLLAAYGETLPPRTRDETEVAPAGQRPAQHLQRGADALPVCLPPLTQEERRPPLRVAVLANAQVVVWQHKVGVFDLRGEAQPDLSVRCIPALLRRCVDEARAGGMPVDDVELDEAVLLSDEFPSPNLCHFLFDHAPRLLIYRAAGAELGRVTVIGPAPEREYQRDVVARFGVARWQATNAPARLRVRKLWVSSNCNQLRHPAHWASPWLIEGMRGLFDLAPRAPRRILVSRADAWGRRIANQEEVAAALPGFETIVPGQMSFAEQVAAFRDATHVVAGHGAALGNLLFCQPGTHVLEAFHPHYGTWAYAMVSNPLGLRYAAMVGRDGDSDAPEFNDTELAAQMRDAHSKRDIRVDLERLQDWLRASGL